VDKPEYDAYWDDYEDPTWELYIVTMRDVDSGKRIGPTVPVYAANFDEAITVYEIMIRIGDDYERSEYS